MRKTFTKTLLEMRAPAEGRVEVRDAESPLVFRLTDIGDRKLTVRTRINGKQVRLTYPKAATIENLSDARTWARSAVDACKTGDDPRETQEATEKALQRAAELAERRRFGTVVKTYLERRVRQEKKLRSADDIAKVFDIYFLPRWGDLAVTEIGLGDVNDALDQIYDGKVELDGKLYGGPIAADRALAQLRACFNWYARRDGGFKSPIVTGMARTSLAAQKRDRVLDEAEIRALWAVTAGMGPFNAIVRTLLLTAQRRDEVACMVRSEIAGDVWTIPAERYKTAKPNVVPLTPKVLAIIEAQDKIGKADIVFTTNGKTGIGSFGKSKAKLDADMLAELRKSDPDAALPDWRLHDLRRTARSLMSKAGVRPDVSERVLGHVIAGVEGVYDHYDYVAEKRDALERLAGLVEMILAPPADNVVRLVS